MRVIGIEKDGLLYCVHAPIFGGARANNNQKDVNDTE